MIAEINNAKRVDILYDNNKISIDGDSIAMFHIESEEDYNYDPATYERHMFQSSPLYIGIKLKHITRKRFVKLLMGKCMNKRLAEQFADFIFKRYGYYSQYFIAFF